MSSDATATPDTAQPPPPAAPPVPIPPAPEPQQLLAWEAWADPMGVPGHVARAAAVAAGWAKHQEVTGAQFKAAVQSMESAASR